MKYSLLAGIERLVIAAAVLLLAAAFAGCTSDTGVPLTADESAPATISALDSAVPRPSGMTNATGSAPCGGCFSHTGNSPETPMPSPYAVGGVVVRYDDPACSGQCAEGCVCVCEDSGCDEQEDGPIPGSGDGADKPEGSLCGVAQTECACDCVCSRN